jgi:hypothetical protein
MAGLPSGPAIGPKDWQHSKTSRLLTQKGFEMDLIIKLDTDDARVLHQLLKKMSELTWPPQCDVYNRISDKLMLAEKEAGLCKEDQRFHVIA